MSTRYRIEMADPRVGHLGGLFDTIEQAEHHIDTHLSAPIERAFIITKVTES
jgi:hypothetical protein